MVQSFTAIDYSGDTFYREHAAAGLDYAVSGKWHEAYALMVTDATLQRQYKSPAVLDFGCACGATLHAFRKTSVFDLCAGIDVSDAMVKIGRQKFSFSSYQLITGSVSEISIFSDDVFTLITTSQVLEHIHEDDVPRLFREFFRVMMPGGRMFHHFDALKFGDKPDAYNFDPTHVNIKPQIYWQEQFVKAGFVPDFESYDRFALSPHTISGGDTFHKHYPSWSACAWIKP